MIKKVLFVIIIFTTAAIAVVVCFWLLDLENNKIYNLQDKIQNTEHIQILFVGDLMFDRGIRYFADKNKDNYFIFSKIKNILQKQDLVIANLEGPITNNESISSGTAPGSKNNYFFTFDPEVTNVFFNHKIKMVSLANNHILNFGEKGLKSTKKYLELAGIEYFGAPDSNKSKITEINGFKIGFVGYNEFYGDIKTEQKEAIEEIKKIKNLADIVVVFCHWGAEYQPKPHESQIEIGRQFIDNGADLIIGSHPHVIQPMEEYKNPEEKIKRIYYSLGNFIFDQYFNEEVRRGLGVEVKINKETKQMEFNEINFYLDSNGQTIEKILKK